jgi:hypothetical protein
VARDNDRANLNGASSAACLPGRVTPHTLRHTAATWLRQCGVDKWEAAGFFGMSVEMIDRVYGHHHPDNLRTAARAIGFGRRVPLAARSDARRPVLQVIENIGGGRGSNLLHVGPRDGK